MRQATDKESGIVGISWGQVLVRELDPGLTDVGYPTHPALKNLGLLLRRYRAKRYGSEAEQEMFPSGKSLMQKCPMGNQGREPAKHSGSKFPVCAQFTPYTVFIDSFSDADYVFKAVMRGDLVNGSVG